MKKRPLIIKNITHENPGLIIDVLNEYNLEFDIIDLSKTIIFPEINDHNLIIILGGPDSANDESEKITKELKYICKGLDKEIPIFGICLGLQLLIKAIGGIVYKNPVDEIGFKYDDKYYKIQLTQDGLKDPIFKGIKDEFIAFQLHRETIKILPKIQVLGTGEICKNQIVKLDDFNYGFQFHFELNQALLNDWIEYAPELKYQNKEIILNDFNSIKGEYMKRGKRIFTNFLNSIELI